MEGGPGKVCSSRLLEVLFQGVLGHGTTVSAWISLHSYCDSAFLLRTLQRLLGRAGVQLHSLALPVSTFSSASPLNSHLL